jgi:hypothetical protein
MSHTQWILLSALIVVLVFTALMLRAWRYGYPKARHRAPQRAVLRTQGENATRHAA